MVDYVIEFGTLAADSGWNIPSLLDAFHHRLSESIKDQLVGMEYPSNLD